MASYSLSFLISTSCASIIVADASHFSPSAAALALTYSYLIPYFLLHFVFIMNMIQVCLTSLERVLQYSDESVSQEPAWHLPATDPAPGKWPTGGSIGFEAAELRYRPDLAPAVSDCSFHIKPGERVGIVGRSGAGKTSLLTLLFRIVDASAGRVTVDGLDIAKLGLLTLRRAMSIIPQEPLLIAGSIRTNLDPFNRHGDAKLRNVLSRVGLAQRQDEDILDADVGPGGSALSAGERQLLALGRALLLESRIVVCDEPTSNM